MAVHHAVGISRQRNSGYRPNRINIMAQGLSTPDPSLSHTHLSIRTGRTTTTHYTHHQVSLMASHNTTLVPSWSCTLGQPVRQASALACEGSVCQPKEARKKYRRILCQLFASDNSDVVTKSLNGATFLISTKLPILNDSDSSRLCNAK